MRPNPFDALARDHDRVIKLASWAFAGFGAAVVLMGVLLVFDDPAGFIVIPFGLAFVGAGWLVRRIFMTPEGKRRIQVSTDAFVTTRRDGRIGETRTTYFVDVDADATDAEIEAAKAAWAERRFANRPDWATGRILAEGERRGGMYKLAAILWLAFALVSLATAWIWGGIAWLLAPGACGVAGALTFFAFRSALRRRKFGESAFEMATTPARLGGRLRGVIETGIPLDQSLPDGFRLTLRCERRWEEQSSAGRGAATDTVMRVESQWEAEAGASPHAVGAGLAAPVDFEIPSDLPPSTLGQVNSGVFWELEIYAETPGLDYGARFVLPVLAPDRTD